MKKLLLCLLLSTTPFLANPPVSDEIDIVMLIKTNGDYDSIDIAKQDPETRKILHKLAYQQYLKHNQWAAFKACLLACSLVAVAAGGTVFYLQSK